MLFLVVVVNDECTCSSFLTSSEYRCIRVYFNSSRSQFPQLLHAWIRLYVNCCWNVRFFWPIWPQGQILTLCTLWLSWGLKTASERTFHGAECLLLPAECRAYQWGDVSVLVVVVLVVVVVVVIVLVVVSRRMPSVSVKKCVNCRNAIVSWSFNLITWNSSTINSSWYVHCAHCMSACFACRTHNGSYGNRTLVTVNCCWNVRFFWPIWPQGQILTFCFYSWPCCCWPRPQPCDAVVSFSWVTEARFALSTSLRFSEKFWARFSFAALC